MRRGGSRCLQLVEPCERLIDRAQHLVDRPVSLDALLEARLFAGLPTAFRLDLNEDSATTKHAHKIRTAGISHAELHGIATYVREPAVVAIEQDLPRATEREKDCIHELRFLHLKVPLARRCLGRLFPAWTLRVAHRTFPGS